jgi:ubiquinone biosynthesis protein
MWHALRNFVRLCTCAWILARHGALAPLATIPQAPALAFAARFVLLFRDRRYDRLRPGERLAAALNSLGPSFIKFGQSLATRSDLIGEEQAHDLSQLQDRLKPFPVDIAKRTLESELGCSIDGLFSSFDEKPIAAASIAQVHFAVTTEGDEVAVKILRPDIEKRFARDLDLFRWIAELLEAHWPWIRRLKPVQVIELFAETIVMEMDLRMEAAAASELAENFKGDPSFRVPTVNWSRTTARVMTVERVHGTRIDDLETLMEQNLEPTEILRRAATAFFNQVFRDGFFHADMHPGNAFVDAEGYIVPVDFGIMGRLDQKTRYFLADMLTGFLTGDYRKVAEVHFQAGYVPAHKSIDAFTQACRSIGEPLLGRPLHEISVARLLAQLFRITEQFEMETQPQLLLLQKTMVVAEGVGRTLNPLVNMWELPRPMIEEWMLEHRGPQARIREVASQAITLTERLPQMLEATDRVMGSLTESGVKLHPETVARFVEESAKRRRSFWPVWLALAIAVTALLFG